MSVQDIVEIAEGVGRFLTMFGIGNVAVSALIFLIYPTDIQRTILIFAFSVFALGMVLWGIGLYARKQK